MNEQLYCACQEYQLLPIGLLTLDESLIITHANPRFCEIFACEAEQLHTRPLEEIFSHKDRKGISQFYSKISQYDGGFVDLQLTFNINNKDYYVRFRAIKMETQWTAYIENTLISNDITHEFLVAQERWENIFKNSEGGIVILDSQQRVLEHNNIFFETMRFCSSHGVFLSDEALHGKNVFQLFEGDELQWLSTAFNTIKSGSSGKVEQFSWYKMRYFQIRIGAIRLPIKGFMGCFIIFQDLTERKQAEERQSKLLVELQQTNHELSKTLAELENTQTQLIEATRAKSIFLANMSHEIRTPLNAIIGMTDLLAELSTTPVQQDYIRTIAISGETLLALINDILDFSKIEAGKLELEHNPFDLRACVENSLEMLAPKVFEKGLDLAYVMDISVPDMIVGDVTRVRQILINQLSNAVKFTQQGEILVSIRAETVDTEHVLVYFSIKDTGIGIAPDRLHRLFRSFSQIDVSTARQYGGTGLGLAISKNLCEMMGGNIQAESKVDEGSTFTFCIRAATVSEQPYEYLRKQHIPLFNKKIIIYSSHATSRQLLQNYTECWGMIVQLVAHPEELQHLLPDPTCSLAIIDMPPVLQLIEHFLKILSSFHYQATFPLILLTAAHYCPYPEPAFATTLNKPLKPSKLYDSLIDQFGVHTHKTILQPDFNTMDIPKENKALRILLAEDNKVNQKVALITLQRLGYQADVANNGLEVLESLRKHPYDIVLMDVQMPEMDGLTATKHIIAEWSMAQRPWIIAMTANAMQGDREECLQAGMNDYITKPIRREELAHLLETYSTKLHGE
jgi:PAS domain S-box-containing protein